MKYMFLIALTCFALSGVAVASPMSGSLSVGAAQMEIIKVGGSVGYPDSGKTNKKPVLTDKTNKKPKL